MEKIYKTAFLKSKITSFYYVNLMYEGQNSELIKKQKIDEIPLLVIYQNGMEQKRLKGTAGEEQVVKFLQ